MIRMASSSGRSVAFAMGRRTAVTVASSSSSSSSRNALLAAGGVAVLAASVVSNTKDFFCCGELRVLTNDPLTLTVLWLFFSTCKHTTCFVIVLLGHVMKLFLLSCTVDGATTPHASNDCLYYNHTLSNSIRPTKRKRRTTFSLASRRRKLSKKWKTNSVPIGRATFSFSLDHPVSYY